MRVFISSLIRGMEALRDAADDAIATLGHEAVRAESFGARPETPQVACLQGVRNCGAMVLIMGEHYGATQPSGLSATHEEYREARERCPVLVFVQDGVEPEASQRAFLNEVQGWVGGHFTQRFTTSEVLRRAVTRALHQVELARATGPIDGEEMLARANALMPDDRRTAGAKLAVAVAGGPRQSVLRPAQIEDAKLRKELAQDAIFGEWPVLSSERGSRPRIENHRLIIDQGEGAIVLDEQGSVCVVMPIEREGPMAAIIEEDVREAIERALRFIGGVLDRIDGVDRLSHVAVTVSILGAGYFGWRTRREHEASPNTMQMNMHGDEHFRPINLTPPHRPRAALRQDTAAIAQDLTVLLRRLWRT